MDSTKLTCPRCRRRRPAGKFPKGSILCLHCTRSDEIELQRRSGVAVQNEANAKAFEEAQEALLPLKEELERARLAASTNINRGPGSRYWRQIREERRRAQNNRCAICQVEFSESVRCVLDHCHETGALRDALCGYCNTGIGLLRHDPEIARRASKYLIRHRRRNFHLNLEMKKAVSSDGLGYQPSMEGRRS